MQDTSAEFRTLLSETLKDPLFLRRERQSISQFLEQQNLTDAQLDEYRAIAFDVAKQSIPDPTSRQSIDWLEQMNKLLVRHSGPSDNAVCEAYFSPGDHCRSRIVQLLQTAVNQIDLCVFTITDDRISREILAAHRRGRKVRILSDCRKCGDEGNDVEMLEGQGIPVKFGQTIGHMHHKFGIFDAQRVLTGSYNWTVGAARDNYENVIVSNDRKLVGCFVNEFERLWGGLGS